MKLINNLYYYFRNLDNYTWVNENNQIIVIKDTTWFWMFSLYPLVSFYYLDEIGKDGEILGKLNVLTRYDFIKYMHILTNENN